MLIDASRLVREPPGDWAAPLWIPFLVRVPGETADTEKVFREGALPWSFVHDLPDKHVTGELGKVEPHDPARVVRLVDTQWYNDPGAQVIPAPFVWWPHEGRRVVRVAWLASHEVIVTPISSVEAKRRCEGRFPLAPYCEAFKVFDRNFPGDTEQPICFEQRFTRRRTALRFLFAAWEI